MLFFLICFIFPVNIFLLITLFIGDSLDLKPINTRKLRRRGNEPNESRSYPGEKRRKQGQATLTYLLDDNDISEDLKIINKTLKVKD